MNPGLREMPSISLVNESRPLVLLLIVVWDRMISGRLANGLMISARAASFGGLNDDEASAFVVESEASS
jgi:hypothetical protein